MKLPRWLEIQAEVDYWHYCLAKMLQQEKNLLPIERMIEHATGYDKKKLLDVKRIIKRIEKLKKEFYSLEEK